MNFQKKQFAVKYAKKENETVRTIKVAGDQQYPPFEFIDNSGDYRGSNVDLMRAIAFKMNINLEFYPMNWDEAQRALLKGEVDVIQGMNYSLRRAEEYLFCFPSLTSRQVIFAPRDKEGLNSVDDLAQMTVSIQEGDISEDILGQVAGIDLKKFSSQDEAIKALVFGEVNAFMGNESTGMYLLEKMNCRNNFREIRTISQGTTYGPVVRKEDQRIFKLFNEGLYKGFDNYKRFIAMGTNPDIFTKDEEVIDTKKTHSNTGIMLGDSSSTREVLKIIDKVKNIDSVILISGETGTGKDLVARMIHSQGKRKGGPLEIVNCAALPVNLLESELFGYEKGAFTGAINKYHGKFRLADGGTLFLDEIGEMEPLIQAKLLRVLQDKTVKPLGSSLSHRVDVRIVAATNKNLSTEVKEGRFREDLFYRLNVINIQVLPLRERKEDLPFLIDNILDKMAEKLGQKKKRINLAVFIVLQNYHFPGNVRELENILERACVFSDGDIIELLDLPPYVFSNQDKKIIDSNNDGVMIYSGEPLDQVEQKVILMNLKNLKKSKKEIAEVLGISERTLRNKIKYYEQG